ncbi:hypothetical protein QJ856_gp1266 [Tupanvirus deep ocean]|uniref:Uncharacterized protein n=2 Tax=Tupanvirus TaxID=2094720 RepID=A0AC62A6T2_9VIRU|nr:hypothetical protein QJ856_gp1266 [Tupanvirus deep ocean]QKU33499.1 hypothetical protein [Tupanvirus deep ocean]
MKLITLIASHIDNRKRLQHFIKLLGTINNQVDYFDDIDVRISLSHDKNINRDEMNFLLEKINKNNFKFHFHDKQLYQFEHYKFLVNELNQFDDENTWIIFSDDDDEWADNRLAAYHHMINYISTSEYEKTTSICYSNDKTKTIGNYTGSYIDYCVKLKYLKVFMENVTNEQLQHKFCDCYFVKFLCTYGLGVLKRAFCATDDNLYYWIQHEDDPEYSEKYKSMKLKESLENNLDLYIAQYSNPTATDWIKFCDVYTNNKITNGEISPEMKKFIIKIYLEKFQNHIFNSKYLPIFKNEI